MQNRFRSCTEMDVSGSVVRLCPGKGQCVFRRADCIWDILSSELLGGDAGCGL